MITFFPYIPFVNYHYWNYFLQKRWNVVYETSIYPKWYIYISLVCYKSDITPNCIVLSYLHHPKAQALLCKAEGNLQLSMHCLEIGMIKYISLSSVIARKLNFQKLLLKKIMHFELCHTCSKRAKNYIFIYRGPKNCIPNSVHN